MKFTQSCAACALLALPTIAWCQAVPAGDPVAGQLKTQMCGGCHGIPGWRTAYPEVYGVPKIGGQHPAYIVKALQAYKSGERNHPSMRAIAATLSDQDMADLAAYYGGAEARTEAKAKEVCQACHGLDGNSQTPDYPKLGGQRQDYLAKALRDYKSGARKNAIMAGFAGTLSPKDIEDLAAHYAAQPPVLVVKH